MVDIFSNLSTSSHPPFASPSASGEMDIPKVEKLSVGANPPDGRTLSQSLFSLVHPMSSRFATLMNATFEGEFGSLN